ncbi:MAG: Radical superfamily protein [Dehalococcoidales bacterium]|nr:Radical superfamily protein [Dehalococcoidales bacterium]
MTEIPGSDDTSVTGDIARLKNYSFEMGAIRPPSEGGSFSLLLRVTRNCPWNRCTFCYGNPYHHERFELRPVEEVKADIDSAKALSNELSRLSTKLGYGGRIEPLATLIQSNLLHSQYTRELTEDELKNLHSIVNVFNWLCAGGKTAFLQDADTPVMHTDQLVSVINYLKETFPSLERVTSYARSKTIVKKTPEELRRLHEAGLSRLHIGLETGDDELLSYVSKGVTAEEHILAGRKALEAGFELSVYVMPGLGGKRWWVQHARNTARVLNEINPNFIRMRPFVPRPNTPIFEAYQKGEFELTSPHERLAEIKLMIDNLQVTSRVCFDHNLNPSYRSGNRLIPLLKQDYDGYKFPEEKGVVLELIEQGLKLDEKGFVHARDMVSQTNL